MSQGARVSSLDALGAFKAALQKFHDHAQQALLEADMEIQRVEDWLNNDRPIFWKHEKKKREDEVARAKDELRRITLSISEHKPSAVEQKKALKRAQQRLEEAREKIRIVDVWKRQFERAKNEYRGQTQHIHDAVDSTIPRTIVLVERLMADLHAYLSVAPPEAEGKKESRPAGQSMARSSTEPAHQGPRITLEECLALRAHTPTPEQRDDAETGVAVSDLPRHSGPETPVIDLADHIDFSPVSSQAGDLVVYDRDCFAAKRLYLQRIDTEALGDSGWFVGSADDAPAPAPRYGACSVSRLLGSRPEWKQLLSLPPGSLAVVEGGELLMVVDRNDKVRYSADKSPAAGGSTNKRSTA